MITRATRAFSGHYQAYSTLQHFKLTSLALITRAFHAWCGYARYLYPLDTDKDTLVMTASLSMSKSGEENTFPLCFALLLLFNVYQSN